MMNNGNDCVSCSLEASYVVEFHWRDVSLHMFITLLKPCHKHYLCHLWQRIKYIKKDLNSQWFAIKAVSLIPRKHGCITHTENHLCEGEICTLMTQCSLSCSLSQWSWQYSVCDISGLQRWWTKWKQNWQMDKKNIV